MFSISNSNNNKKKQVLSLSLSRKTLAPCRGWAGGREGYLHVPTPASLSPASVQSQGLEGMGAPTVAREPHQGLQIQVPFAVLRVPVAAASAAGPDRMLRSEATHTLEQATVRA